VSKGPGFHYLLLNTDWGIISSINIGISKKKLEIIETKEGHFGLVYEFR